MEIPLSQPLNLCYCYAYEDRKYAQDLDTHLTALKRSEVVQACSGCAFAPHGPWEQKVADHINTAHLVLLLISAHFLRSEELYHYEIAFALERHGRGEACVIPIFLSDVVLEGTYLNELRMLPNNDEFISRSRDKAHAFADIVREVQRVANEMGETLAKQAEQFQYELASLGNSDISVSSQRQAGFLSVSWVPQTTWLAAGATDGSVYFYNVNDHNDRYLIPSHMRDVYSVVWFDNLLASSSADCTVRLWDASKQSITQILQGHTGIVNSVAWSPDGERIASASADNTLRLWDARNGSTLRVLAGHTQSVMSVSWSPDSKLLASGSCDRTVRLWDTRSGRELPLLQHRADIMSVSWSPDSHFLAMGVGNDVKLWEVNSRKTLYTLQGHTSTVTAVSWSPDGKSLASGSRDQTVRLWDPFLEKRLHSLQGHIKGVTGIAWSHDGKSLAAVSHGELSLWNTETGELIATLDNQQVLRTTIHQPERTLQVEILPYNDEDPEEFPQQEVERGEFLYQKRTIQEQETLQEKPTLICPYCYKPFPEKRVHNRRKRGLTETICDNCRTSVSLLVSLEQLGDNIVGEVNGESPQQRMQTILRQKKDAQAFDVFFCYNHQDKRAVEQIGEQLQRYGILPWLDEWELRPGLPREPGLERQIKRTKTAAVFVGQNGLVPWQRMEIYALLREFAERGCPVIPVLLSDAPDKPDLPLFLKGTPWADFRVQDPDPMQRLLWGITGKK